MTGRTRGTVAALGLAAGLLASRAAAVTVTSAAAGGTTPQQLAEAVADGPSGAAVVAGSASTVVNSAAGTPSNSRSFGTFAGGLTAPGTPLPPDNNDGAPAAVYAGGVGAATGVCLCTGAVTDADPSNPLLAGRGVGVEGPNNGYRDTPQPMHEGEIGLNLQPLGSIDADFDAAVFDSTMTTNPELANSSDPVVLKFNVALGAPAFLRVRTVFGSDEHPAFNTPQQAFNDSFAILVRKTAGTTPYENIAVLNMGGMRSPFSLHALAACGAPQFKENQVAPLPAALPPSLHAIDKNGDGVGNAADGVPHYDHEFGGFTSLRTWETRYPLAPGTYTVKFVIHDVADGNVDSALFIAQDSLKAFSFLPADFDLDGDVDGADFLIWQRNFGRFGNAKFTDGDASGDGNVTSADAQILIANWGRGGGNGDFSADFDRDGDVDNADLAIWTANFGLATCASRYEGDADGDGDVDGSDFLIWQQQFGRGGGGGQLAAAGMEGRRTSSIDAAEAAWEEPVELGEADADGDGLITIEDVEEWMNRAAESEATP